MDKQSPNFLKKNPNSESRINNKYPLLRPLWIGLLIDVLGFYIIIP